jgi:hypothetical protein
MGGASSGYDEKISRAEMYSWIKKQLVTFIAAAICGATMFIAATVSRIFTNAIAQTLPPTIAIKDVIGLTNALIIRPQMGAGYQLGRTAVINQSGQLEGVSGNADDCVRVGGISGPCGGSGAGTGGPPGTNLVDSETPGGTLDGSNVKFTLQTSPVPSSSFKLYLNGVRLSVGSDYLLAGNIITLTVPIPPLPRDTLLADYRY